MDRRTRSTRPTPSHDLRKWFRRWGVGDLLELSGNVMQYVMIEERLMESLRKKWEDAKRTKLEYYIAKEEHN